MASGTGEKKIKVAWICHFSNKEVQDILKPWKKIGEMAPWIPSLARIIEGTDNIELHIISPHEYIPWLKEFNLRGIHYHFYNPHIPLWGRHWPVIFKFDYWSDFVLNKFLVRRIINKIKPDLIHLHGAENAYYSSTIFQFKYKYPVFVTLQGFLYKISETAKDFITRKKIAWELKIYKSFKHFGIRTETMGKEIGILNPGAIFHWHGYVINLTNVPKEISREKKYDIVYFAKIAKSKGIEDLIEAVAVLKKQNKEISALIIGQAVSEYIDELKKKCINLEIEPNITWAGFLPTQHDVHHAASQARICVLPSHYDMIPGTIIESMFLKIPVVAYDVGSIHEVNDKEDIISLVDKGNINGLAYVIMSLLKDESLQQERARKGYAKACEMLDTKKVLHDLLLAYDELIANNNVQ